MYSYITLDSLRLGGFNSYPGEIFIDIEKTKNVLKNSIGQVNTKQKEHFNVFIIYPYIFI